MQLKSILNRVQKFKSFVYGRVVWVGEGEAAELEVEVVERANGRALCSRDMGTVYLSQEKGDEDRHD